MSHKTFGKPRGGAWKDADNKISEKRETVKSPNNLAFNDKP